jgi:phage terminase Nu1 subunit (DNA packaging protein)
MACSEDGPKALSQAALARALGVSPAMVVKLKAQGMPIVSVEAAIAWRTQHLNIAKRKPLLAAGLARPRSLRLESKRDRARTSREETEAQLAELDLAQRKGMLVSRHKVRAELAGLVLSFRDSLRQIPARLSAVLAAETDQAKCDDILSDEIDRTLEAFIAAIQR